MKKIIFIAIAMMVLATAAGYAEESKGKKLALDDEDQVKASAILYMESKYSACKDRMNVWITRETESYRKVYASCMHDKNAYADTFAARKKRGVWKIEERYKPVALR